MLLGVRYLSLDPYMRGRMSYAPSYAAPVAVGEVMIGATVAAVLEVATHRVRETPASGLAYSGWQSVAVSRDRDARGLGPADGVPV